MIVRRDDRIMTVITGLVLVLIVGLIAQNSNAIVTWFSPRAQVDLRPDYYVVDQGKTQTLDILRNDRIVGVNAAIVVIEQPRCGALEVAGEAINYTTSDDCTGNIKFSYCIAGIEDCTPAVASVNLRPNADLRMVQSDQTAPSQDISEDAQISALVVTLGMPRQRPKPSAPLDLELPQTDRDEEVAATVQTPVAIPQPRRQIAPLRPFEHAQAVARADVGGCAVEMRVGLARHASVNVALRHPCAPATMVEIEHQGLVFAATLDDQGAAILTIPAMASDAMISARFADIKDDLSLPLRVPHLTGTTRIAVVLDPADGLELQAREFGAGPQPEVISFGENPLSGPNAARGHLTHFEGAQGRSIQVYSHAPVPYRKFAQLSLQGDASEACAKTTRVDMLRAGQRAPKPHSIYFDLPNCAQSGQRVQHLSDVVLAAR
jgi:hypothetical protein